MEDEKEVKNYNNGHSDAVDYLSELFREDEDEQITAMHEHDRR